MLRKFLLKPGVNRENTRYTTEGGWYESEKVRFRQGTPEKIGGWERISANTFLGICRSLWAWVSATTRLKGVLTNRRSYVEYNGNYYNISPVSYYPGSGFSVQTTSGSSVIKVTAPYSILNVYYQNAVGSYLYFFETNGIDVNITASVINNKYFTITAVTGTSIFSVDVGVAANATAVIYPTGYVQTGEPVYQYNGVYSQSNFGRDLIFNQRGGEINVWNGSYDFLLGNTGFYFTTGTITSLNFSVAASVEITGRIPVYLRSNNATALPSPLSQTTKYWIARSSGNIFYLYASETAASPISTTPTAPVFNTFEVFIAAQNLRQLTQADVDAPEKCNFVLVSDIYRFVFALGCNDYGTTTSAVGASPFQPMLIRWSDQESYVTWTPSATNQAGSLVLSRGSEIITAIQARQEVLIWTDTSLYSLQYQGPPTVWGAQLVGDNISVISQNSVAYAVGSAFWMGKDKFYIYSGTVTTLNCNLRQYVFSDINKDEYNQIFAGTNEGFNEVWWFYCSANSVTVDRYVIYNYAENIWYYGNLDRTAWLDSGILEYPLAATYSNNLVYHEKGLDNNTSGTPAAITASITSSEFDVEDGDQFMFIRRVLPDLTFRNSTAASPSGVLTFYPLKNSGSGYTDPASVGGDSNATVTRTATVPIEAFTGQVYVRLRARQLAMKFESTGVGVSWQFGAIRMDIQPDGKASGSGVSGG